MKTGFRIAAFVPLLVLAAPAAAQNSDVAPGSQGGATQAPPMGNTSHLTPGMNGGGSGKAYYVNGNIITGFGNGLAGANTSVIETGSTIFGYLQNSLTPARLADDYTVPAGQSWSPKTLRWTGYQTGAPTTGTLTGLFIQVWCGGSPMVGGAVCAGDLTTNRLASQAFTGVYRVTSTTLTNTQRALIRLQADLSTFVPLQAAGTYWLDCSVSGTLASGPWAPPTTPAKPTDNAQQFFNAAWTQLSEPGLPGHDMYFELAYVPTPASVCGTYCTSSTTSIAGCAASMSCAGTPSLGAASGYTVTASPGPGGGNLGILYASKVWGATTPMGTGFICGAAPVLFRSAAKSGGGTAGACNGAWTFSLADIQASGISLVANDQAWVGIWFRDPPSFGLSNGLSFVAVP